MKDLHTEYHKAVMKEIKEDQTKWKDIMCSLVKRLKWLKCQYSQQPSLI